MPDPSSDLALLQAGQPPLGDEWVEQMTVGRDVWLDPFCAHYLGNYVRNGGSKVKVLVGSEGAGKTHLLRYVAMKARALGYLTVSLSLRQWTSKLSDIVGLYKVVATHLDCEEMVRGLCRVVAGKLGFGPDEYDGSGSILPLLVEKDGLQRNVALKELRKAAASAFRESDLSPAFYTLGYTLVANRMATETRAVTEASCKWLSGEKLEPAEKRMSRLYDRLTKPNARVWLYSLIRLLRLSGKAGVVVLIDDVEAVTERTPDTGRFLYTPNATKDTFELVRQLIDDVDLLQHFLLLLSGRPELIEDVRRGFKSYEALWMRLQSGLVPSGCFNPFADMVNVDDHLVALGSGLAEAIPQRLQEIFARHGMPRRYREIPEPETRSLVRRAVIETALMIGTEEA